MAGKPLLLFCWLLFAVPAGMQAQFDCATNNNEIIITGYFGTNSNVVIPGIINGLPVTDIGVQAFSQQDNITNVLLPDSVTSLENSAFSDCSNLVEITFGSDLANIEDYTFDNDVSLANVNIVGNLVNIGAYAFGNCYGLAGAPMGTNVESIGEGAFDNCYSLTNVTIPDSVTNVGPDAFYDCNSMSSLTIGTNVISIGNDAFADCTSLTNAIIPASVANLGDGAFVNCPGLTGIDVDAENSVYGSIAGVLFNKSQTTLIQYPAGNAAAFYTIPDTVTALGDNAFVDVQGLTGLEIPAGVTHVGTPPFPGCLKLAKINVDERNPAYSSGAGVLFDKNRTRLIQYPPGKVGSYTTPASVTSILDYAFEDCFGLNTVTVSSGVGSIGAYAFEDCFGLTNVIMGGGVTSIGDEAFYHCNSLTNVFFLGNAPGADATIFFNEEPYSYDLVTVYYLPGTGWSSTFAGRPTAIWTLPYPVILNGGLGFGLQSDRFGFTISWATNLAVIVEACTNLAHPDWQRIQTNILYNGSSYFSDLQWTNYPLRFYRVTSP